MLEVVKIVFDEDFEVAEVAPGGGLALLVEGGSRCGIRVLTEEIQERDTEEEEI